MQLSNVFNKDESAFGTSSSDNTNNDNDKGETIQKSVNEYALSMIMNTDYDMTAIRNNNNINNNNKVVHNNHIYSFEFHDYFTRDRKIEEFSLMSYIMSWTCWNVVSIYDRRDFLKD